MQQIVNAECERRALIVDDDEGVRRSIQLLLHWQGYDVRSFAAALPLLASKEIDQARLLIADYRLPDGTGVDVRRALAARGWSGRSILVTGYPDDALTDLAWASGFDAVLEKPLQQRCLMASLTP